jgi:DNA-binding transcriptional LysR family regulator
LDINEPLAVNPIDLRRLNQFAVLAEELHFGRAARRLHMTQPPLTQAIQGLEALLAVRLFERSKRSVVLTPAGEALLEQARRLLRQAEALPGIVQAAAQGFSGHLRLAFVSSIAYGPLPGWLRGFRLAHPEVQLQLREATLDVQLAAFADDDIDTGFVLHAPGAAPAGFAAWSALHEPLVLALPEGHPLAAPRRPRAATPAAVLSQVLAEPLVIFPRVIAPSLFDAVLAFYRGHGVAPRIAQEAIQMQTIINLVSVGMGVAWVPASVTQLQRPGVVYRPLPQAGLFSETSLLWREPVLPTVQRFIAHVKAAAASQRQSRAVQNRS